MTSDGLRYGYGLHFFRRTAVDDSLYPIYHGGGINRDSLLGILKSMQSSLQASESLSSDEAFFLDVPQSSSLFRIDYDLLRTYAKTWVGGMYDQLQNSIMTTDDVLNHLEFNDCLPFFLASEFCRPLWFRAPTFRLSIHLHARISRCLSEDAWYHHSYGETPVYVNYRGDDLNDTYGWWRRLDSAILNKILLCLTTDFPTTGPREQPDNPDQGYYEREERFLIHTIQKALDGEIEILVDQTS